MPQQLYSNLVSRCYRSVTCTVFITFVCLSNSTVTLFHVVTDLLPVLYLLLLYASATLYSNLVSHCYRSVLYCIYFFCMPQQLCTVTLFHVVTDLLPVLYLLLLYASATLYSNLVSRCYRSVTCTVFISFICLSNSVQ